MYMYGVGTKGSTVVAIGHAPRELCVLGTGSLAMDCKSLHLTPSLADKPKHS